MLVGYTHLRLTQFADVLDTPDVHGQSIKIDIGKPLDKSITTDEFNLNVVNFIDQSIKLHTHIWSWS